MMAAPDPAHHKCSVLAEQGNKDGPEGTGP